jgi:hypothetical protein
MKIKKAEFSLGDWVWYWYPRRYKQRSQKWQSMYTGPFLIVRYIAPVNYVLQKSAKSKPFVVHADKLKKCFSVTPKSWLDVSSDNATSNVETGEEDSREITLPDTRIGEKNHKTKQYNTVMKHVDDVEGENDNASDDGMRIRSKRENRQKPRRFYDFVL